MTRPTIARLLLTAIKPLGALTGLALTAVDVWLSIQLWPNLLAIIIIGPLVLTIGLWLTTPLAWALGGLALVADRETAEAWMTEKEAYEAW